MLFRQMQYFISIVKNNSFTEAAEENYISQSAISQAKKSLEDELDVKLLERKNRGFTLTNCQGATILPGIAIRSSLVKESKSKIENWIK